MRSFQVTDIDFESISNQRYDISLFASGYESRCIFLPNMLSRKIVENPLIFGFMEARYSGNREINDIYFKNYWAPEIIPLSGDDEKPIYENISKFSRALDGSVHILVDYSSMSRLWYAAVLNWARFASSGKDVIIDFIYAMGKYEEEKQPMVIRDMVCIPGCEGQAYHLRESVAVFGLGFHGPAALCVLDRLEADTVYVFMASPGSSTEYINKTREMNIDLINDYRTKAVLELPLASIETCYRNLADTIAPHRPDGEITLVPMGPKPHVLASILVAMRFREVSCLRVSGTLDPVDVKSTGEISATRVIFHGDY